MFETEDMLPRAAPKPTLSLDQNEPVAKPTVPEVSILFNQATTPIAQQNKPIQSYASWRKQMLPKVTYPPGADSTAIVKSSLPPAMPQIRPIPATEVLTICAGTQTDSIGSSTQCNADVATKQDYQQLLGILQEMRLGQQRLTEMCVILMEQQQQQNKRAFLKDASTQYEAVQATCQQRQAVLIKDYHASEQYEIQQPSPNSCNQKCLPNAQQQQTQQNFQTPRVRPTAQSTGYRPNSPLINNIPQQHQNQLQQNVMSKPATEQSMVMNELALKYLPNDKLNEMLQDMRLSPTQQKVINDAAATATPLRNIENIDKEPNDISNASYKYLKKYRLLPEEHQQQHQQQQPQLSPLLQKQQKLQFQREQSPLAGHPRAMQENLLDLDAIRRQPKFL